MFTPRDFQLRISRRRTNQKTSRSPVFAIGSAPVLQPDKTDTVARSWRSLVGTVGGLF
jgi:hypothetical protein